MCSVRIPACICHRFLLVLALLAFASISSAAPPSDADLYTSLTTDFGRLAPQTIRPADGYIHYPYLIPAGYYAQMWDWDGFFIGAHWANQNAADAKYLRDWVLGFASSADDDGYVAGCITPRGPRPLFGKFAMKPFLGTGSAARFGSNSTTTTGCAPCGPRCSASSPTASARSSIRKWNLWFWDNAMQSGADNNPALSNDPKDRSAILAVDASVWAMREYLAMAALADHLGDPRRRTQLSSSRPPPPAMRSSRSFGRRTTPCFSTAGATRARGCASISWSNFLPLVDGLLPPADARRMIRRHLLNPEEMQSPYGFPQPRQKRPRLQQPGHHQSLLQLARPHLDQRQLP